MAQKQDLINSTHAQLRETSSILSEERTVLDGLKRREKDRQEIKQKIANLRRATLDERRRVTSQSNGQRSPDVAKIGDADSPFHPSNVEDWQQLVETTASSQQLRASLMPKQLHSLKALPSTPLLLARTSAYKSNNSSLRQYSSSLQSRSADLESKYRRIISLCTDVSENKVEQNLQSLVQAVQSERGDTDGGPGGQGKEGGVDIGRVREFLRSVEGVGVDE
jgi:regulatory protein SWI6